MPGRHPGRRRAVLVRAIVTLAMIVTLQFGVARAEEEESATELAKKTQNPDDRPHHQPALAVPGAGQDLRQRGRAR